MEEFAKSKGYKNLKEMINDYSDLLSYESQGMIYKILSALARDIIKYKTTK